MCNDKSNMNIQDRALTATELAQAFGVETHLVNEWAGDVLSSSDFRYRRLGQEERDLVLLGVLKELDEGTLTQVGAHRQGIWNEVWCEQLDRFNAAENSLASLDPKFVAAKPIMRVLGDYAIATDPRLELNLYAAVRQILFKRWLSEVESIYEFGCGSCFNLAHFAKLNPALRLVGLDWSVAATKLAEKLGKNNLNITGRHFDFFQPDENLILDSNSAAVTFCALEQVGDKFTPFLDFLLNQKPTICLHMEPIEEFYQKDDVFDWLALRYHKMRGYLTGFHTRLKELEDEGRLEILDAKRLGFGSLHHEGFSVVVWRPIS